MDLHELDYSDLFLNPMVVPKKKSPEDVYDEWRSYKEFTEPTPEIDRKKLFRYIPLVYGAKSPLHKVITDIKKLKGKAAELAGFIKQEDGSFLKPVEEMMACLNREVNYMIVRYITLHKSSLYHETCILREAHLKLSVSVLEEPTDKNLKNFKEIGRQVDESVQELLSQDNAKNLQEDFYQYYLEDKLMLRPEDIAYKRDKGEPLA